MVPTLLIVILAIVVVLGMVRAVLTDQQVQGQLVVLMLLIAAGWIVWSKVPRPIRTGVRRVVTRMTRRSNGGRQ